MSIETGCNDQETNRPQAAPDRAPRLVEVFYDGEAFRPERPLDLPPGTRLRIALLDGPAPVSRTAWLAGLLRKERHVFWLFALGIVLYLTTRFTGLTLFPIYFFCDEAIQTNLARELLNNGLRSNDGTFLPPYFLNAEKWNLSLSVYIHLFGVALFSNSIVLTRSVSVLVSLLAPIAIALTLKLVFQNRFWWAAPLLLTITPAWFLHSRTAFETVMMVAFYACFLCCYLLYRYRSPRYLFAAGVFGAMTFYSYANGQGVMLISMVLLLLLDLPYHLRQRLETLLGAAGLALVLAIPFLRFRILQPEAIEDQFLELHSYWTKPGPLNEKLITFWSNYLEGLNPAYWFLPNIVDLERHRWLGLGHLHWLTAPFILAGLLVCLRNWRSPAHRAVLVAILAAPFSAALVDISITRVLAMLVPATLLTVLGLEAMVKLLRRPAAYGLAAIGVTTVGVVFGVLMLRSALLEAPTWFTNYGLGGMQYGAQQLFVETIPDLLAEQPETTLLISPTWANNPDTFPVFFLDPAQRARIQFVNIDAFSFARRDLKQSMLFIMPEYEYARAQLDRKFVLGRPERVVPYPDGRPGFYVVRLAYVEGVDAIFAEERAARQQLVDGEATIDGQVVPIAFSRLDIGRIVDIFDGDANTLMRGLEANPLVIELRFPEPRALSGLDLTVASMEAELTVIAEQLDGATTRTTQTYTGMPPDPTLNFTMPERLLTVERLRIELRQLHVGEVAHVHVRELVLR